MSESMRLANECKADRVDQFYAALHESRFWHKADMARCPKSCPLLEVKRISLPGRAHMGLAIRAERAIFVGMSKPRVTFKMQRIAEDDWQILADYPGAETRYIKGLKSKAEVDEWLNGTRRIDWLRSQGYAK
jgi:hypothetical protein